MTPKAKEILNAIKAAGVARAGEAQRHRAPKSQDEVRADQRAVRDAKVLQLREVEDAVRRQRAIDSVWEQTLRERERQARVDAGPMTPTDPMGLWNGQR